MCGALNSLVVMELLVITGVDEEEEEEEDGEEEEMGAYIPHRV